MNYKHYRELIYIFLHLFHKKEINHLTCIFKEIRTMKHVKNIYSIFIIRF